MRERRAALPKRIEVEEVPKEIQADPTAKLDEIAPASVALDVESQAPKMAEPPAMASPREQLRAVRTILKSPQAWTALAINSAGGYTWGAIYDGSLTIYLHGRYNLNSQDA